jgi:NADH dehydrogenase
VVGDVRHPATLEASFAGVQTVVSAVHGFVGQHGSPRSVDDRGNANLINGAARHGAQFVLMSAVGAAESSPMELFRMKYAAEERLKSSGIAWTIVRATAFLELWIDVLNQTARKSGRPLVFGRGENPINFVAVRDVATLVERVVVDTSTRGRTLEIGGVENLSFNQFAAALLSAGRVGGPPRHVPPAGLVLMAQTLGRIKPELGRQARAALAMDRFDFTMTGAGARAVFPDLPTTTLADLLADPVGVNQG